MADLQSPEARSGFLLGRVIHIHPTRLCNLACLHCYSESNSHQKAALDLDILRPALPLLKSEGYNQLSISGGEPLMFQSLLPMIDLAHEAGFRVTMITNGLASPRRLDEVSARLDGIAISFDGLAPTHNYLRGRPDSFQRACAALSRLADSGRPVGAAISLTRAAIAELPDLADHLASLGAQVLQVRPMAMAGRAKTMAHGAYFSPLDRARLYLVVLALQEELAGRAKVHCDLAPAKSLWQQRDAYATLLATCATGTENPLANRPLADLVNPLVITESGVLRPVAYDFNPVYDIGAMPMLYDGQLKLYKQNRLQDFRLLLGRALVQLENNEGLVDWFDHCTRFSELRDSSSNFATLDAV